MINDTIELKGLTFRVSIEHDDSRGAPWDEHDGHGPVRTDYKDGKKPGERILTPTGSRDWWYLYAWAEASRIAKRDGWGLAPDALAALTKKLGREPKPGEVREAAVQADFDYLRRYLNDDWTYIGVVVALLDVDGEPTSETESLWGIESDAHGYINETARELAGEIARRVGRKKYLERGAVRVKVRK